MCGPHSAPACVHMGTCHRAPRAGRQPPPPPAPSWGPRLQPQSWALAPSGPPDSPGPHRPGTTFPPWRWGDEGRAGRPAFIQASSPREVEEAPAGQRLRIWARPGERRQPCKDALTHHLGSTPPEAPWSPSVSSLGPALLPYAGGLTQGRAGPGQGLGTVPWGPAGRQGQPSPGPHGAVQCSRGGEAWGQDLRSVTRGL